MMLKTIIKTRNICSVSLPLASGYGYCHAPFFYDGFDLHQGAITVSAVAAAADQTIEGIELDRAASCLRECSPLKSEMPSTPSSTASPSITNELLRFRSAASVISG
jgi:hypothetical protein